MIFYFTKEPSIPVMISASWVLLITEEKKNNQANFKQGKHLNKQTEDRIKNIWGANIASRVVASNFEAIFLIESQ